MKKPPRRAVEGRRRMENPALPEVIEGRDRIVSRIGEAEVVLTAGGITIGGRSAWKIPEFIPDRNQ